MTARMSSFRWRFENFNNVMPYPRYSTKRAGMSIVNHISRGGGRFFFPHCPQKNCKLGSIGDTSQMMEYPHNPPPKWGSGKSYRRFFEKMHFFQFFPLNHFAPRRRICGFIISQIPIRCAKACSFEWH